MVTKEKFTLTLTYEMSVDTDTGEILETTLIDRSVNKPSKKPLIINDDDTIEKPKLILDENKCSLNKSAISLLNISPGDKVDIKYENKDGKSSPIIGLDESFGTKGGTKFNKSGTFSYRGNKNVELAKYGKEFILTEHPTKDGLFVLTSTNDSEVAVSESKEGDDNVQLPVNDINLDDLIGDEDNQIEEIDSNLFNFNL